MDTDPKHILLVSSSGGVLLDLLALEPWWSRYTVVWAAVQAADTESALNAWCVRWIRETSLRQPYNLVPALVRAWSILHREDPDLIISAGSGAAIPFFLIARLFGIPTFWVSTFNVLVTPGVSAKICARLATRVLLQRQSMLAAHPQGVVIGELY